MAPHQENCFWSGSEADSVGESRTVAGIFWRHSPIGERSENWSWRRGCVSLRYGWVRSDFLLSAKNSHSDANCRCSFASACQTRCSFASACQNEQVNISGGWSSVLARHYLEQVKMNNQPDDVIIAAVETYCTHKNIPTTDTTIITASKNRVGTFSSIVVDWTNRRILANYPREVAHYNETREGEDFVTWASVPTLEMTDAGGADLHLNTENSGVNLWPFCCKKIAPYRARHLDLENHFTALIKSVCFSVFSSTKNKIE